jgi:integrase
MAVNVNIIKRENGVFYLDYRISGKRYKESTGFRDRRQAERAAVRKEAELVEQKITGVMPRKVISPKQLFAEYLAWGLSRKKSPKTLFGERRQLKPWEIYFEKSKITDLADIKPLVIRDFQLKFGPTHSPRTWNNHLMLLKTCLNVAVQWGYLEYNPIAMLKPEPVRSVDRVYTDAELKQLLEFASPRIQNAILLARYAGLRLEEVAAVRWKDIDFEERILRVRCDKEVRTKNNLARVVPMCSALVSGLNREVQPDPVPYDTTQSTSKNPEERTSTGGCTRKERSIQRYFYKCKLKAGINGRFHDLRHTFATDLANKGVSLDIRASLMGHLDLKMTKGYSHLSPQALRDAVNLLG